MKKFEARFSMADCAAGHECPPHEHSHNITGCRAALWLLLLSSSSAKVISAAVSAMAPTSAFDFLRTSPRLGV